MSNGRGPAGGPRPAPSAGGADGRLTAPGAGGAAARSPRPTWCAGCGDYGVLTALERAVADLGLDPDRVCLVSGIGCSGKISSYFGAYGFHGLHGRTLPLATGIKLANRGLTVIAAGGDGDGYAIGLSHLIHAIRRNVDITYVVMDNNIYGLTTGQTSPTSRRGFKSKTSPAGSVEAPVDPLALALASGITYLAQGFSGDIVLLTDLIRGAIGHRGFALVNVLSPCVTFNPGYGYDFYKENLRRLGDPAAGAPHDPADRVQALRRVIESGGLIQGLIYREERPSYEDALAGYGEAPLAEQDFTLSRERWDALIAEFV